MSMHTLRVGVLMGGRSIEREVSFNSGRTVCDHLDTSLYTIVPLFQRADGTLFILPWHFLHRGKITDFEHRLDTQAQRITWDALKNNIDFMYIATHGRYAEDGILQGTLEVLGIPYLGSKVLSSALSMDKHLQKDIMARAGIDVPRGITVTPDDVDNWATRESNIIEQLAQQNVSLPYIVKPLAEGSSLGISVVYHHSDLYRAVVAACTVYEHTRQAVLIEEKIIGMEFSCITLTDYKTGTLLPLPPTEIVHEEGTHFFDYEQKYMPGRAFKYTPARCDQKTIDAIHAACIRVSQVLEITTISRIDGFVTPDGRVVIVDPNTLSGMGPASFLFREAAEINMSHTAVINHLIETELRQYGMSQHLHSVQQKESTTMQQKIRVVVLMGGNSNEREISLESGRNITYKLSPEKYTVIPVFVSEAMTLHILNQSLLVRNSTTEIADNLHLATSIDWSELPTIADFVFIGLHGGMGENGSVQGMLEMLDMPYNGSGVLTSALCMDKFKTARYLASKGFDVPRSVLVSQQEWQTNQDAILDSLEQELPLPMIIKPHDDGCSVMVQKARTRQEIMHAITTIFAGNKEHALVEECIHGMELTVGVIGNNTPRALPPSQAVTTSDILSIEEKFLPGAGENQTPAPLPAAALEHVQKVMQDAYLALGCKGYVRIDCFYQNAEQSPTGTARVIMLEVNTLPGMTPATCLFHQAAEVGIRPMDFVDMIVSYGFELHAKAPHARAVDTTTHTTVSI